MDETVATTRVNSHGHWMIQSKGVKTMKRVFRVIYILVIMGWGGWLSSFSVHGVTTMEQTGESEALHQSNDVSASANVKPENMISIQMGYWGDVKYIREYDKKTGYHVVTVQASDKGNMTGDCTFRPWGFLWATNVKKIIFDNSHGMIRFPSDSREMFKDCYNLKEIDFSGLDTNGITNTSNMFAHCYELETFDFANINTDDVTDMSQMFNQCYSLKNIDFRTINTSKVTSMRGMFAYCTDLETLDLSKFDTTNVTDMSNMFDHCVQLESLNLSSFDTTQVKSFDMMFANCERINTFDLSLFNTSNLKKMNRMFLECKQLESVNLSSFDTTRVSSRMMSLFENCHNLREITLGAQTKLASYIQVREASSEAGYTGLWGAVGDGTAEKPRANWTGNVADLIERSEQGIGDTYVWQPTYRVLTFVADHASPPSPIKIYPGETLSKESLPTLVSDEVYYQFKGWTTEKEQEETMFEQFLVTDQDTTFYAYWQPCYSLTAVPSSFYFGITQRDEYQDQWIPLQRVASQMEETVSLSWYGAKHWQVSVYMEKWQNPDNLSDCLDDVQLMFKNTLKKEEADSIPASITHTDNIILSENETIQLVSMTSDTEENDGNWSLALPFNQVFLKIPRYGGREGSYYASQLTWSLDDTL